MIGLARAAGLHTVITGAFAVPAMPGPTGQAGASTARERAAAASAIRWS
jgi:hypothetical protein